MTRDFNTPFELKDLEQFYGEHKTELGTAKRKRSTLNQIEKVRASLKWMEDYHQTVFDWLIQSVGNDFVVE